MDIDCTNRLCGSIGRGTAPTSSHSSGSFTNMPQLGTSSCSLVPGPDCPFTTARPRELTSLAQVNFSTDGFAESSLPFDRSSTEKNRLRFACTSSLCGVPSREPSCVATAIKWTALPSFGSGLALLWDSSESPQFFSCRHIERGEKYPRTSPPPIPQTTTTPATNGAEVVK